MFNFHISFRYMLILTLVCAVTVASCGRKDGREGNGQRTMRGGPPGGKNGNAGIEEVIPVEVDTPKRTDLTSFVFGNTHIEALRQVEIISRVEGRLEKMLVEEGDWVSSGGVLAELNKSELQLAYQEAGAKLENDKSNYERARQMLAKELTSQEALDNTKYQYETSLAQYERAKLNLEYATITAPFSGLVTGRLVELGDMIRVGNVLFDMADNKYLLARVYVPEKEAAMIDIGDRVRLESEMFPGQSFYGNVDMIAPVIDPQSGTIKITVKIASDLDKLKPGMFCSVYILTETHENSLVITRKALIGNIEDAEVYVVDDSLRVSRRNIQIGIEQGDTLEVVSGLTDTDKVVTIGQEALREGAKVKIPGMEITEPARPKMQDSTKVESLKTAERRVHPARGEVRR